MADKPVVKPKAEQQVLQGFWKEYQALCEKHQCRMVVTPAFQARDDGTWSVVLQTGVGRMPRKSQRPTQLNKKIEG